MSAHYIVAIDQGTTGSTALIVDFSEAKDPKVIGKKTIDFTQHYPQSGWVAHDLDEVWASVAKACKGAMEHASQADSKFKKEAPGGKRLRTSK